MDTGVICNGDALATMARMPDGFVDLVVTSPPYDKLRKYNGYSFDFEGIAQELYRVIKLGGVVVWIVGDSTVGGSESGTSFRQALYFKECGFRLHDTMIYEAEKPPMNHRRYEQKFEYMFVFSKGSPKTFNPIMLPTIRGGTRSRSDGKARGSNMEKSAIRYRNEETLVKGTKVRGNIWRYAIGLHGSTSDDIAFDHPAIFPEQLARDHILSWSNEGDLVYDPFGGSGTVPKMAILENRDWLMSEISSEYATIAAKRLAPYVACR